MIDEWKDRAAHRPLENRGRQAGEAVAWAKHDLDAMCEAFHRVIESHAGSKSPFHNPVSADAQIALRGLRGFIPQMQYLASLPAPQAVQAGGVPAGWRFELVSDGDVRVYGPDCETWLLRAADKGTFEGFAHRMVLALAAAPSPDGKAEQAEAPSDVVAFEFYNPITGHAIVDYTVNTHVGRLGKEQGYEVRPLGYANPPPAAVKLGDPVPLWQALEALDSLEESARGDAPYSHFAANIIRTALEQAATQPTASNAGEREAPKWPNFETAMEDPLFQQARAIMGTNTWFQDNALRNVINYVLSTIKPAACKGIPRPGCSYLAPCDTSCNKCGEIHHHYQMVAALATKPPAGEQKPVDSKRRANAFAMIEAQLMLVQHGGARADLLKALADLYLGPQPEQVAQDSAVLAFLDDLKDDAAAHIWPDDLERCQTSECVVEVTSVRMGSPDGKTVPLFSREQVAEAIRAARARGEVKP